jgi:hypothetical protein
VVGGSLSSSVPARRSEELSTGAGAPPSGAARGGTQTAAQPASGEKALGEKALGSEAGAGGGARPRVTAASASGAPAPTPACEPAAGQAPSASVKEQMARMLAEAEEFCLR